MKYLKKFEKYNPNLKDPDNAYFQRCLFSFLNRIKTDDFALKSGYYEDGNAHPAIVLNIVDNRQGYRYRKDKPVLTIRVLQVTDKQLRNIKTKSKFKIYLNTFYDTTRVADQIFLDALIEFLKTTFTKYSYWNKDRYNSGKYEYFIDTSNIDNIETELNDFDIEVYKNMKKFNI